MHSLFGWECTNIGFHIAWSESSAVCYANSVLGARTNREGGPGALSAAICGRTALYGYHLDDGRHPNLFVEIETSMKGSDFGALGYLVGKTVGGGIPYFKFKNSPSTDQLKWLGAALASSVRLHFIMLRTLPLKVSGPWKFLKKIK